MDKLYPKFTVAGTNGSHPMVDSRLAENALDERDGKIGVLTATRDQWAKELDSKERTIKELRAYNAQASTELAEAKAELQKLRPPEAKFRVGQVVYNHKWPGNNGLHKILAVRYVPVAPGAEGLWGFWYRHSEGESHESNLRELTEEER